MRSEYRANLYLESLAAKVQRIMNSKMPYSMRLAAVLASDGNKGKVW